MEPMTESEETLSDVIRLLVGDLDERETVKESVTQEDPSADSIRVRRWTSEGGRTAVDSGYDLSRFNHECRGKYSLNTIQCTPFMY